MLIIIKIGKIFGARFLFNADFYWFSTFSKRFLYLDYYLKPLRVWNPDSYYNWLWWLWFGRLFWIFYIFCYFSFEIVHKHIQISPLIQWSCDFIMEYKWLSMPLVSKLTIIIYLDIYSMNWVYPKSWHLL